MRLIVIAIFVHAAHCWRPLGLRDPLSDPTNEYSPPVTSGVQYWAPEPPSVRLEPPPPMMPLPWLTTVHVTTAASTSVQWPPSTTTSLPIIFVTSPRPSSTTTTTTTVTPVISAVVIQGHSKVKKYGPVQGSINSVLHQSGKPM